ncbi:hypothetical protein RHGRI_021097 [Rhododendron griersonianum]|uniref:Uncharacterized protein n=1 Tax=Rhododendron griersonianum TaxID=479676 RepID=A0AAV6JIU1_9ERIC|nr:hypothetical protein RHGRI_021097 [Rhododendron griersonianum]
MEPKKKPTTERKMKTLPQNSTIHELSYRISDLPDVSVKSFPARHCSGSAFAACERRTARVLALKLGPPEDSPWISSSNEIPRPDLLFTSSFSTCTYRHV